MDSFPFANDSVTFDPEKIQHDYLGYGYSLTILANGFRGFMETRGSPFPMATGITMAVYAIHGAGKTAVFPKEVNQSLVVSCVYGLGTVVAQTFRRRIQNKPIPFSSRFVLAYSFVMIGKCYYVKYTTDQRLPIFSYLNEKVQNTRNRFQKLIGSAPVSETCVEKDINLNADTSSKNVTDMVSK